MALFYYSSTLQECHAVGVYSPHLPQNKKGAEKASKIICGDLWTSVGFTFNAADCVETKNSNNCRICTMP